MATPHTTKYQDEPKIPATMNPLPIPLINTTKAQPSASPTTLTPGLEAMHLTATSPFSTPTPTTPIPKALSTPVAPEGPVLSLSPGVKLTHEEYLELKALHTNGVKILRQKTILFFFSAAETPEQIAAAKALHASILKMKNAVEMQARTADEAVFRGYHALLIRLLMRANREFLEKYGAFKEVVEARMDVWEKEVREIEGLVKNWEGYP